ncbi:hypothetical protein V4V56_003796 [Vibrio mimicus]|uniref:hypothetical protein n=1 Tax=Vibrio mimicus TaxID=674 RepID=UPI0012AD0A96|nr:hypothetical protein [Vibrio mimicus]
MNKRRTRNNKKHTEGYRKLSDYPQLSYDARHRLFYTKHTVNNPKEARILKWAQKTASYRFQFFYYISGAVSFMIWAATGIEFVTLLGCVGLGYVFYRYIRMTWSYEERVTYEREYPVKTITEVHNELVRDGLVTSFCSIGMTIIMFVLVYVWKTLT